MRTPPLLADFSHARACKPFCENSLTLPVSQAMAFTSPAGLTTFPVCPACMATLEREGQNFCDHCGQRLDWRWYKHAQIIYPGQKSALNILDKDDVLIST